jgi:di/tricarboxylate transporter
VTTEAGKTCGVLIAVLVALIWTRIGPHLILLGGLVALLLMGVIDEAAALSGFANPAVITIAALFAVVAGLRETGAIHTLAEPVLGRPKTEAVAQARLMLPIAALSAFVPNTPLVAAALPVVHGWAKRMGFSVSRLLIPLSYASILGGACTLIGTTTILVVNGMIMGEATARLDANQSLLGLPIGGIGMFELAVVSVPCAVGGLVFLMLAGRVLLPERKPAVSVGDDVRQYTVEMRVDDNSPLEGKGIEDAGLRHLHGLYLVEVERGDQVIPAPSGNFVLESGDHLVFVGVVESVMDLQQVRGLSPVTDPQYRPNEARANRVLVEVVVSERNPLIGRTIRDGRFRTRYNAAIVAVARHGERVEKKIGDIRLRPGDTLLLEARTSFAAQQRNSRDFYLVSQVADAAAPRRDKAWLSVLILVGMVVAMTLMPHRILTVALLAALATVATRCASATVAMRIIDWPVLLVIATALGIGEAMKSSGLADQMAGGLMAMGGQDPRLNMALILVVTMLFTNLVNAKAAAALMFPIAIGAAEALGVSAMPFAIAIMVGAAASFITPIGYQTNLMVYGPGGYRFGDYLRAGLPLSLIVAAIAIAIIPVIWPFQNL